MHLRILSVLILLLLGVGALSTFTAITEIRKSVALDQVNEMLSGSRGSLRSITLSGQYQRIVIDDEEGLLYFTQAFRSANKGTRVLGTSYSASIEMSSGCTLTCGAYVPDNLPMTIIVGVPRPGLFGDYEMYTLNLTEPVPGNTLAQLQLLGVARGKPGK